MSFLGKIFGFDSKSEEAENSATGSTAETAVNTAKTIFKQSAAAAKKLADAAWENREGLTNAAKAGARVAVAAAKSVAREPKPLAITCTNIALKLRQEHQLLAKRPLRQV